MVVPSAFVFLPSPAEAAGPKCEQHRRNKGNCVIKIAKPGEPAQSSSSGGVQPIKAPAKGGGGDGTSTAQTCAEADGREVPCSSSFGNWSNSLQGYCQPASPQPPKSDPVWRSQTTGVILMCNAAPGSPASGGGWVWAPGAPGANGGPPVPTMTPAEAAAIVMRQLDMNGPGIGIVPEPEPGRLGLVGMPVWMWVADPGPTTVGPQTVTGSAGGITITATAKVTSITWHMGDGAVITCTGPGTPYQDHYGKRSSPDCGHTYSRTSRSQPGGRYPVVASSHWQIDWNGGGDSGQETLDVEGRTSIAVGELQVLVTH